MILEICLNYSEFWNPSFSKGTFCFFGFIRETNSILVYIDDIVITDNDAQKINELQLYLQKKLQTKDLRQL